MGASKRQVEGLNWPWEQVQAGRTMTGQREVPRDRTRRQGQAGREEVARDDR